MIRMAYYIVCPNCGSNLDPGEKCTCMEEKTMQQDFLSRHLRVDKAGQLTFAFDEMLKKTGGRERE